MVSEPQGNCSRALPGSTASAGCSILVKDHVRCLDCETAPRGHGIASIHHQVHQDLLDLPWVGLHRCQTGAENRQEINILTDHSLQHRVNVCNHGIEVQNFGLKDLLAAEGQ